MDAPATPLRVSVRTWTMHTLTFEASNSDTVAMLKEKLREAYGTDTPSQLLTYQGRKLEDRTTLGELRLGRGAILQLTMTQQSAAAMRVYCPKGLGVAQELAAADPELMVFVFDMDDTLTKNGVLVPGIKQCLERLRDKGHFLAIASFNRSAVEVLRMNGVDHMFHVIVCGWNVRSRKTQHMRHVFRVLGWSPTQSRKCFFYDDQLDNIRDVRREMASDNKLLQCVYVTSPRQVPTLVSSCEEGLQPPGQGAVNGGGNALPDIYSPLRVSKAGTGTGKNLRSPMRNSMPSNSTFASTTRSQGVRASAG